MSQIIATTLSNGSVSVPTATVVNGSAKAWVNFNGTGTVAIRDSFNVASLTDNAVGKYTVAFSNAFAAADYATVGAGSTFSSGQDSSRGSVILVQAALTSSVVLLTAQNSDNGANPAYNDYFSNSVSNLGDLA